MNIVGEIRDGGDVRVVAGKDGKIYLEIKDHGGLDGSPPEGSSAGLSQRQALDLADELREAAGDPKYGEHSLHIYPLPQKEL